MKLKLNTKEILEISEKDIQCLDDSILDIGTWIRDAVIGKIHNCRKRMINEWIPKFREEGESIPTTDDELVEKIIKHKDYRDRKKRDADEEETRLAQLKESKTGEVTNIN